jgi:hypothetical protein
MAVGAWRRYECGNAVDQLQWCEGDLILSVSSLVASSVIDSTWVSAPIPARLAALLGQQRYTNSLPALRSLSIANGGRAQ